MEVWTLADKFQNPGIHSAVWNGKDNMGNVVPVGVYYCRIQAGNEIQTTEIIKHQ